VRTRSSAAIPHLSRRGIKTPGNIRRASCSCLEDFRSFSDEIQQFHTFALEGVVSEPSSDACINMANASEKAKFGI
jgi:hypothetical protein